MRKVVYFSSSDEDNKTLSNVQFFSLMQDLKLAKLPTRQKLNQIIREYSRYVKTKKASLDKSMIDEIDKLLIAKFNTLINDIEEEILLNKSVSMLLGITQPDFKKAADSFGRVYKRMLIARNSFKYIPRENQIKTDDAYKLMIAELRKIVFEPVLEFFSFDPSDIPETAKEDPELTKVLENGKPTPEQLREMIVGFLRNENLENEYEVKIDEVTNNLIIV